MFMNMILIRSDRFRFIGTFLVLLVSQTHDVIISLPFNLLIYALCHLLFHPKSPYSICHMLYSIQYAIFYMTEIAVNFDCATSTTEAQIYTKCVLNTNQLKMGALIQDFCLVSQHTIILILLLSVTSCILTCSLDTKRGHHHPPLEIRVSCAHRSGTDPNNFLNKIT